MKKMHGRPPWWFGAALWSALAGTAAILTAMVVANG